MVKGLRAPQAAAVIDTVLTDPKQQHPWANYYAKRGIARPALADLTPQPDAVQRAKQARAARQAHAAAAPAVSADLVAAVEAVTAQTYVPGSTAAPFITAMQKEAVAREVKRRRRLRYARWGAMAAAGLVAVHLAVSHTVFRRPFESALQAQVERLPEQLLPLYSSGRQPLQPASVAIVQADQLGSGTIRYVAAVTFRLRKPLFAPAVSNGTMQYRRMQESVLAARDQEMRFDLFAGGQAPEFPEMPLLLQRTHQAGETIVVRVPFTARRFGWHWRLERPPVELRIASRMFDGDCLDRYAGSPYLIFGDAANLAGIRARVRQANTYVLAVARAVQRQAQVVAVAETPVETPVQPDDATLPADEGSAVADGVDPNAPAVEEPAPRKVVSHSSARAVAAGRRVM
jgi:hypothetical protein